MKRRQIRAMIRSEEVILALLGAIIGIVVGTELGTALAFSLKKSHEITVISIHFRAWCCA
jgi:ABC-type antimicrobial peptide transport system permease subunit